MTARTATELLQSSLRGYDNRRFGVTAIVASGLRQSSLRGYGKCRFGVTTNAAWGYDKTRCGLPVNTAVCRVYTYRQALKYI